MVIFFYLCNYIYEQAAGLAAQPLRLKELCDAQTCKRRDVSKCFSIEKRHPICHELCDVRNRKGGAFSENATEQGVFLEGQILQLWNQVSSWSFLTKYWYREHFWRDRQPCLKERSDAQACIGFLPNFLYSREVYRFSQQQFLNANFVWNQDEVLQNSRYAKRFYYSRQLSAQTMQHFDDSRHSFAKIAIPYTIYPSLNLPEFYV